MHDIWNGQPALGVHARHAAERRAGHGAAVIAIVAAYDDCALRLALQFPIAARHPHDGVVCFGTGIGKHHAIHMARGDIGNGRR